MKHQREFYLEDIPLEDALDRFSKALDESGVFKTVRSETIGVEEALGRTTAQAVWARNPSPHYHAAAMDGAAIRAEDSEGATESSPVRLKLGEEAQWVDTGRPIPANFDAVVMIEHIQEVGDDQIEIISPVAPWQHVRIMGEDVVPAELLLPRGHTIRARDLGALVQGGVTKVEVVARPTVAIIPTGSELVSAGGALKSGAIVESNSLVLAGLVRECGGEPVRFDPVPDEPDQLLDAVKRAASGYDMVITNAGASAGRRDFTASLVKELGKLLVHGVAIRPGHPVVLGLVAGKPFIGTPGYPVSAVLTFDLFARPLIYRLQATEPPRRPAVKAAITSKVFSPMGEDEFVRVRVGKIGEKTVATPLQRGAGATMSLLRSNGLVRIPRGSEGVMEGQEVTAELLERPEDIENSIVVIGSHDLTLDVLADHLHARYPDRLLSSSNVGSLGGLMALRRGEAHLAGSHLLDEETGEYNLPYLKRLLAGRRLVVLNMVYRDQGLIVAKGNPRRIEGLEDLARKDILYVNRQRGAGTRVLLDYKLRQMGVPAESVRGYEHVEFTHLAVAAAVAAGVADAGMGILAAAKALDLDFVPVTKERYDLIIPLEFYEAPLLEPLLSILKDGTFKAQVDSLGGYDTSEMGAVLAKLPE